MSHSVASDFGKLDCITSIFMSFFSRNQPLVFWKHLFHVFNNVFNLHGATLISRENVRFFKQVAFHLLRQLDLQFFKTITSGKEQILGYIYRVNHFIYNIINYSLLDMNLGPLFSLCHVFLNIRSYELDMIGSSCIFIYSCSIYSCSS